MITIKEDKRSTSPYKDNGMITSQETIDDIKRITELNYRRIVAMRDHELLLEQHKTEWSNVNKQEYNRLIIAMNDKEYEEYINVSDSILNDIKVAPVPLTTEEMEEYIKSLGGSILVYEKKPDKLSIGKKHRVLPNVPKKDRTNLGYQTNRSGMVDAGYGVYRTL